MAEATTQSPSPPGPQLTSGVFNLPNKITIARFVLSIAYFALLAFADDPGPVGAEAATWGRWQADTNSLLHDAGFLCFLIAACTDVLDGYLARKYNLVTDFGRVTDPFVDKISVCGSFVFFVSFPSIRSVVPAWLVVAILAREFLVHGIRSLAESKGIPYAASFWGKQKMVLQCIAVSCVLCYHNHLNGVAWAEGLAAAVVWLTLLSTVVSGVVYLYEARKVFNG